MPSTFQGFMCYPVAIIVRLLQAISFEYAVLLNMGLASLVGFFAYLERELEMSSRSFSQILWICMEAIVVLMCKILPLRLMLVFQKIYLQFHDQKCFLMKRALWPQLLV